MRGRTPVGPARFWGLALLGLWAGLGAPAPAQELLAHPTDPVTAVPLGEATEEVSPVVFQASAADAPAADPLRALIASTATLSVADADALLHDAYDAYPTPTTRARAFGAAAEAASAAGRHELALAWSDWAISEAARAPERDLLLAERLAGGIAAALAAGNPVLARDYVRRGGALSPGGRDAAAERSVVFDRLGLVCPDVIANAYLRTRAGAERTEPGLLATPSAECVYIPIQGTADRGFRVVGIRSFMDLEARTREVADQGLGVRELEARRDLLRRLSALRTGVEPLFLDGGEKGFLAYARHDRAGVDDVAAFAYATAARDGIFYAASADASVWDWPPAELGARAAAGLQAVLDASGAAP